MLIKNLKAKGVLTPVMALLLLALLYGLGFRIPCLFYKYTGILCPGCGITRMCFSILELDFIMAFKQNPLCFILSFPGILYFIYYIYCRYYEKPYKIIPSTISYILLLVTILFTILRNLPYMDFLKPI